MLRKISIPALLSFMVIGICSYTFIEKTEKPKKKKNASTESKKESDSDKKEEPAQASSSIVWYDMSKGYAKAKKEKKILIVDVYTDWCGWCKVMDKETYENSEIVSMVNKYAVAVKFNPEKNGKHIIDKDTMTSAQLTKYLSNGSRISGYPTTFFWKDFTKTSSIQTYAGYLDANSMKAVLNSNINN